jgi:hypothetical protein
MAITKSLGHTIFFVSNLEHNITNIILVDASEDSGGICCFACALEFVTKLLDFVRPGLGDKVLALLVIELSVVAVFGLVEMG